MKSKLNIKNAKLIGGTIGILLFILVIAGATYAWFTWRSNNVIVGGNTSCFDIDYEKSENITDGNLILFDETKIFPNSNQITIKPGMVITHVSANLKPGCDINAVMDINITVNSLSSSYTSTGDSSGALKYVVAEYSSSDYPDPSVTALAGNTFTTLKKEAITSTGKKNILEVSLPKDNNKKEYLIIFYIDGKTVTDSSQYADFSATIDAEARQVVQSD